MLTVIFGAGASYDSDASRRLGKALRSDPPPLANELFAPRDAFKAELNRFPQCRPIVDRLRFLREGKSIEEELEALEDEGRVYPERIRQLMAVRFYLQSIIFVCTEQWLRTADRTTNYLSLIDRIRHSQNEPVTLVTFNYDLLLDDAIEQVTQRTIGTNMDSYARLERFALFKVHGSVNWGRVVRNHGSGVEYSTDSIIPTLIGNAPDLEFTDDYRLVVGHQPPIVISENEVTIPAVAVPVRTKTTFECPPAQLGDLEDRLRQTTHLLIVGWRGVDHHFLTMLCRALPDRTIVEIVAGPKAGLPDPPGQEVSVRLTEAVRTCGRGISITCRYQDCGFSDYLRGQMYEQLFRESRNSLTM